MKKNKPQISLEGTVPIIATSKRIIATKLSAQEHIVSHFRAIKLKHCDIVLAETNLGLCFHGFKLWRNPHLSDLSIT